MGEYCDTQAFVNRIQYFIINHDIRKFMSTLLPSSQLCYRAYGNRVDSNRVDNHEALELNIAINAAMLSHNLYFCHSAVYCYSKTEKYLDKIIISLLFLGNIADML